MSKGHLARFTALAVATGTLVAVGSAPAGAATVNTDRIFSAASSGAVLRVEINLPAGVPGVVPQHIVQDIVLSDGAARTGDSAAALANGFLGQNGNVSALQGLLDGKAQSSLSTADGNYALADVPANPLGLTGGALKAVSKVANPNVDGVISSSSSSIASLELKGSGALGAVLAPVEAVLSQALGVTAAGPAAAPAGSSPVAPVTTTVSEVLGTALDALDEVTSDASAPVSDQTRAAVETLTATINGLLADLNTQVLNISASDSLLDVGLVESTQQVTRKAGTVTSQVSNKLVGIDLLGGLVTVDGIESNALASLGNGGASDADANATILRAKVGDLVSLELADTLRAQLGGAVGDALPADVLGTVNDAVAQVTTLLTSTLGLQNPTQSTVTEKATADEATAAASAAVLVLDPLRTPATPLLRIGFVPAEASVKAQSVTSTPVTPTTVPVSLPRTGGDEALAAIAFSLIGGALVLRRRRVTA